MKYILPGLLFIGFSAVAQKPFFPAYDYFEVRDPKFFAHEVTSAYVFPDSRERDTTTLGQWLNTLEPIQRHFFFCAAVFQVGDDAEWEPLMVYIPKYQEDILNGLRGLSFPEEQISCFSKVLEHISLLKRKGARYKPFYGCEVDLHNDATESRLSQFARANFDRLFSTDLENGLNPQYSGSLTKQKYQQQYTLQVKNGIPVSEEIRDTLGELYRRTFFSSAGKDSCRQWLYKNGFLKRETIEKPGESLDIEYYDTGKTFKVDYRHYSKKENVDMDSMATLFYHESGRKLYERISSSIGLPKDLGSFWTEKAWDDSGKIEYEKGNGILSTYELKEGKLHIPKRELKLDSSLFLAFTPLLHWEDSTRAFVDAVTKDYIRTHPWAGYSSSAETCIASLSSNTKSRLDSFQQAVLSPVFEVICSIYQPWQELDSLPLTTEFKKSVAKTDPHEKLKKELIVNRFHGFSFGTETLHRIYLLQNNEPIKQQSWYYPQKGETEETNYGRSRWDMTIFELQFLKQSASPEELIVWMGRSIGDLHYNYQQAWDYDTVFPEQLKKLLATQDSMERYWHPKLKKLQKKVWKKLNEEEQSQVIALRKVYHEFVRNYRAESQRLRYRLHRNQTPNRGDFYEALYDFIDTEYPNFRYMQMGVHRPAGLVRGELESLSNSIYAGLGKQKEDLQTIEKELFASLKTCYSIWNSPFAWYWRGSNESVLRALNFMMIE